MDTYLIFILGNEHFAVSVSKVLEVLQRQKVTPVPKTPPHIQGIINFRGDILPVIDTRSKFNLPKLNSDEKFLVIVFEIGSKEQKIIIAATADSVKDVLEIKDSDVKPVPELGLNYNSKFISGAINKDDKFILMLDIEKVFTNSDLSNINEIHLTENL